MKTFVDPSAGTKTFGYDQWGNGNKETDANGKVTDLVYDQYGRIVSRTTPEITTTYTYNADGLIQSEASNNGTGKEMTYDAFGRTTSFKETGTEGRWLQKTYTYAQGQVSAVSYTSQSGAITTETNTYQGGYLKKITLEGGQVIYDLQQENALGMATKVLSGPVTRNYSFDQYGMPTGRSAQTPAAGTYMNFEYDFNAATSNLNYRKDVTRSLTENFTYDNLNRLTGFGGQTVSFDSKGNITQKSGIGNFHYLNNNKPYALTGIVQSGNVIPERQQQITYASFSRPLTIAEDGYTAQFTYESGGDRVRMHVAQNGALVLKRHYLANQYELDEKPGSTKEKLYLGGDYYSAGAVLVREDGGAWQVFYINSDYLGSVTHVVNSAGNVVAEYSYDAWGRLRDPITQIAYAAGAQPDLFLGRGYTGHEHLNWFGLINMNARLYDPVHGRFLAPDPYVQAPDFTQSFNRYGYAWGNPLIYTDPNGEFIFTALLPGVGIFIDAALWGAVIGGAGYTASVAFSPGGFQNWNWGQFGKAAGIGALSGVATAGIGSAFGAVGSNGVMGEVARAYTHGFSNGLISQFTGGDFMTGFASGGLSSFAGSAFMMYGGKFGNSTFGNYVFSGAAGGVGAELTGGEFWQGAAVGVVNAGFNHLQQGVEQYKFFRRLRNHYEEGTGTDFNITQNEFKYLLKKGKIDFANATDIGDGYYSASINFYNSDKDLALSFGRATVIYKATNGRNVYHHFYDNMILILNRGAQEVFRMKLLRGHIAHILMGLLSIFII